MLLFFLFLIASFAAPSNQIFIKIGIEGVPPLTFTVLRFLLATLILLPFWYRKKQFFHPKELLLILPFSLNMGLFAIGIQYSSVIMSGILYTLTPILTAVFARLLLKEKFIKEHFIGLAFALAGTGILLKGSIETHDVLSFGTPLGNFLILLAVILWGIYPVSGRILGKTYSSVTITFYNFLSTAILLLITLPFEWMVRPVSPAAISSVTVLSILGSAIIGSALAYYCYQAVIKLTSAFKSSFILYASVIVSIIYGGLFFGEQLTMQLIVGAALIILGVFLATTYTQLKKHNK